LDAALIQVVPAKINFFRRTRGGRVYGWRPSQPARLRRRRGGAVL